MVMKAAPWSARRRSAWARGRGFRGSPVRDPAARPEVFDDRVRYVQTVGGRAGFRPRLVKESLLPHPLRDRLDCLALTIRADGSSDHELVGASVSRHWIYDRDRNLAQGGDIDFKTWYREAHGEHAPGVRRLGCLRDAQAERARAADLGGPHAARRPSDVASWPRTRRSWRRRARRRAVPRPRRRACRGGGRRGDRPGRGPGAILGEGAVVGSGKRNATLRACTPARVAVIAADQIDREALETLAAGRRRPRNLTAHEKGGSP